MSNRLALVCLSLLVTQPVLGDDQKPNVDQLKRELPGTWECVSFPDNPKEMLHIKHLTPTHYTWVTYDRQANAILATSGGTWSFKDDKYVEACEFASDSHQHLRGKTYTYTINVARNKWDLKGVDGTEIAVDEVWSKMKPGEGQKTNSERLGQQLLATWESVSRSPEAPKAMRKVKHVTPTHWIWVIYDRDNKMVLAAAGGPWSIKGGKYEEICEFTTDNFPQARGKSFAYDFKVDGDQWTIKRGPEFEIRNDETWERLK
jgi:hypothetical protein